MEYCDELNGNWVWFERLGSTATGRTLAKSRASLQQSLSDLEPDFGTVMPGLHDVKRALKAGGDANSTSTNLKSFTDVAVQVRCEDLSK
jgi:hypothetical protein